MAPPGEATVEPVELTWTPGSRDLVVDRTWWFSTEARAFDPIALPGAAEEPEGRPRGRWQALPGPGERTIAWFDGDETIEVRASARGGVGVRSRIPRWIAPSDADLARMSGRDGTPENVPFWVDSTTLLVHQFDPVDVRRQACGRLQLAASGGAPRPEGEARAGAWSWEKLRDVGCVDAAFYTVARVELAAPDRLAVYSAAEGISAIDLCRIPGPERAPPAPCPASISALVDPPTQMYGNEGRAVVAFACALTQRALGRLECDDDRDTRADLVAVYARTGSAPELAPVASDLPAGSTLAPSGDRIAWVESGQLCVRTLAEESSQSRCTPLPRP